MHGSATLPAPTPGPAAPYGKSHIIAGLGVIKPKSDFVIFVNHTWCRVARLFLTLVRRCQVTGYWFGYSSNTLHCSSKNSPIKPWLSNVAETELCFVTRADTKLSYTNTYKVYLPKSIASFVTQKSVQSSFTNTLFSVCPSQMGC